MAKLLLQFEGRRTQNVESEVGPYIRANTGNGNFKLSKSVLEALGVIVTDKPKLNFSVLEGRLFIGVHSQGSVIGKDYGFTSTSRSNQITEVFGTKAKDGHNVIIMTVDTENVYDAEDQDGNDMQVIEASFLRSEKAKQKSKKEDPAEEVEVATEA